LYEVSLQSHVLKFYFFFFFFFRNDALQYTKSAVVSAAIGGMFIGGFLVFFLFYARGKCRRYVNGDYHRVPMEYDFELNPRFKTQ